MKSLVLLIICLICICSSAQNVELQLFASGLTNPVNAKHAGEDRLFVAERAGLIKIVNSDGTVLPTAYLNIDASVINTGGEQGLLAIAFHPNYSSNGFLYVNYIDNSGNTIISRFTRNGTNSADPNSELIILNIMQPFPNHNGGDMHFGSDGYLYISTGDGGSGGDPGDRAQNLAVLLGKILRIDVDNASNGNNYAIPVDNPFIADAGALDEIWAYGLRNPWKFSFDRQTNDIWIADVGQSSREEINMMPYSSSGVNYGWRCYEGNLPFDTTGCPAVGTLTFPIADYNHSGTPFTCSITGGYRYRGTTQTGLIGLYFFADFCSDEIGYIEEIGPNFILTFDDQYPGNGWSAFAEDNSGELYVIGLNSGNIFKIVDGNLSVTERDTHNIKIYPNPSTNQLSIDLSNSIDDIISIRIFDTHGRETIKFIPKNNELNTLLTDQFSKGLYLVEIINSKGNKQINKLIIN
ncbi:hypothetical protein A9Q87_00860 [Flavobacteriales bacterium 34_180_T64]|nr:hypothetical protein A9Q87_00860 [Flavobacteriales bacterium 34_180_T64]